ncbi:MAG: hypothetical protein B9S36_07660 [Verrucomicrobiia bacterium Tous-C2TDCM]|nr:MAG: hypothetical protein B9S36_07660 [Verrucomicrobiae bacterium Tous-C2TDCM]
MEGELFTVLDRRPQIDSPTMKMTQLKSPLILLAFSVLNLSTTPVQAGKAWGFPVYAELVLGQPDFVSTGQNASADHVADPQGVCVDPATGKVFVADHFNHRVLRYASADSLANGAAAEIVLGQSGFGFSVKDTSPTAMNEPFDVAIDPDGNLWVADAFNHRVLRFSDAATITTGAAADLVIGQADFVSSTSGSDENQLKYPTALAFDAEGNLYIADADNARVIIHLKPNAKANGARADVMLGQAAYGPPSFMTSQQILHYPGGLVVDANGTLFVSSYATHRILVWENAATLGDGAPADRVIGQPNFTAMADGLSQSEFFIPKHLEIDEEGTLLVADQGNHRILVFRNAASLSGEAPADAVYGQRDFVSNDSGLSDSEFKFPGGVGLDNAGRLIVGDRDNGRVLFFSVRRSQPDVSIIPDSGARIGENLLDSTGASQSVTVKTTSRKMFYHLGIANDGNGVDAFVLRGSSSAPKFRLGYYTGAGANITASVLSGLHLSEELEAGAEEDYEIRLKPKKKSKKAKATVFFSAESLTDGEKDLVLMTTKYTPRS